MTAHIYSHQVVFDANINAATQCLRRCITPLKPVFLNYLAELFFTRRGVLWRRIAKSFTSALLAFLNVPTLWLGFKKILYRRRLQQQIKRSRCFFNPARFAAWTPAFSVYNHSKRHINDRKAVVVRRKYEQVFASIQRSANHPRRSSITMANDDGLMSRKKRRN